MSKLIHCYLNSDLRCGHRGLSKVAQKDGFKVNELEPGNYLVFINTKKDKVKVYAAHQVVAYLMLEKGRSIDLRVIQMIPKAFEGKGRFDYDESLTELLEKKTNSKDGRKTVQ